MLRHLSQMCKSSDTLTERELSFLSGVKAQTPIDGEFESKGRVQPKYWIEWKPETLKEEAGHKIQESWHKKEAVYSVKDSTVTGENASRVFLFAPSFNEAF